VGVFSSFVLIAGSGYGQTTRIPARPSHYVEIVLPAGVASENLFVRYVLAGDDLGGWIQPVSGVSSYLINTVQHGFPATGIKAVVYAPGCGLQTFALSLAPSANPQYFFVCHSLRSAQIVGTMVRSDRLFGRGVKLQAKYIARWAPRFLGVDDRIVIAIPVGDSVVPVNGRFSLTVPDFSADPLAGAPDHQGELQVWVKNPISESVLAQLTPASAGTLTARMGGLKIQREYPPEITFAPCIANPVPVRDRSTGFTLRPGPGDWCDR
jgi:hypothetical protein